MFTHKATGKLLLLFSFLLAGAPLFSQSRNIIGIDLTNEITPRNDFVTGIGATYERKLNKHGSFETGICYRTFKNKIRVYVDQVSFYDFSIAHNYISLPLLYKYRTRVINIEAGPELEAYLGWRSKDQKQLPALNLDDVRGSSIGIGVAGKISKTIMVNRRLAIEPSGRFNAMVSFHRSYFGIGLAAKYNM